jgi:drug/metabolite transporter (DMT)-like permease
LIYICFSKFSTMPWKSKWFQFLVLLLLAFIWGSSFILMKTGLKSFSNSQVAAIRIFLASLVLLPYSLKNLSKISRKNIKSLLIAGFIGSFFPAFLFTKAETRIDSSVAGMLNSMTTIFTFIVGSLFYRTSFRKNQFIGLILGLSGALGLIICNEGTLSFGPFNSYALFIVLATWFYAINGNEIKTHLSYLSGIQITSLAFLFIGPVALIYLSMTSFATVSENPDWPFHLLAIAVLGIVGTALAMILMNSLIRYSSAVFTSSVTYIIPIFAIGWGIIDGEHITALHMVFMSVILAGVYLINRK